MAIPFIDFRPAQVMRNKEVYVCYYVLDPTNDRLKRMRIRCNRIKNRRAEAVSDAGIEVTHIQCGVEGEKRLNFITCAHERPKEEVINGVSYTISSEKGGWNLFVGRLRFGYTIRTWNHSHPKSTNDFSRMPKKCIFASTNHRV